MLAVMALGGALDDLYRATIAYNVFYSGETYRGPLGVLGYLLTLPDACTRGSTALWFLGGLGCAVPRLSARCMRRARLRGAAVGRGRVRVDRGQRQPRSAAVFPAGAAGAGAGRRPRGGAGLAPHVPAGARSCSRSLLVRSRVQRITNFDKAVDYTAWDLARTGAAR